jgi:UbiD family decarboxylase
MPKDLRSFIAELESKSPEDIARVSKAISPRYEITALLTQLEKSKRFPVLFCENVEGSDAPVVINVQASRKLMALALECKPEELAAKFSERQGKPVAPVEVSEGPVHEVVKTGDDVDLTKVPLLTHYDVNAAPYITAGIVVAADPDSGVRNTSYNRLMMARKRELRIFMAVGRHLWTLHNKLERRNEPLPIAIVVGVHPLFSLGAQAKEEFFPTCGGKRDPSASSRVTRYPKTNARSSRSLPSPTGRIIFFRMSMPVTRSISSWGRCRAKRR